MNQLHPFEVTPADFSGQSEETDHRIAWVAATSSSEVEQAVHGTGALVTSLPDSFLESGDIDYRLPEQAQALRSFVLGPNAFTTP